MNMLERKAATTVLQNKAAKGEFHWDWIPQVLNKMLNEEDISRSRFSEIIQEVVSENRDFEI